LIIISSDIYSREGVNWESIENADRDGALGRHNGPGGDWSQDGAHGVWNTVGANHDVCREPHDSPERRDQQR